MSKRNRERRQQRKQTRDQPAPVRDRAELAAFLRNFEEAVKTPEPASWPGACDTSLARPDLIKAELGELASNREPGRAKCRQLEHDLASSVLHGMPDLKHWAMEEFFWHGLPGDSWHPLEAFLSREGARFSPAACTQLRRWKEALIGFFEVGPVNDDRVILREWDPLSREPAGADFPAISLNIGGVNFYRPHQDMISLTYVSGWAPEEGLMCSLGYGRMMDPASAAFFLPLLGLRTPGLIARPVPWKATAAAPQEYAKIWRQRDWPAWLEENLEFPFTGVMTYPDKTIHADQILSVIPSTPEEFRDYGIYLEVDLGAEHGAMGATAIIPCDSTSRNASTLAEYRAYRDMVGLPRAVKRGPFGLEM